MSGSDRPDERHEFIKDIFEPGETRTIDLNDGFAGSRVREGEHMRIIAAEALPPVPIAARLITGCMRSSN